MTGSVSTDINGERQDPNMRMLQTLLHIVSDPPTLPEQQESIRSDSDKIQPAISYTVHGKITPIDSWSDPSYFSSRCGLLWKYVRKCKYCHS
jgi:hypothetical protein